MGFSAANITSVITLSTHPDVPSAPVDTYIHSNNISLMWTPNSDGGITITQYQLQRSKNDVNFGAVYNGAEAAFVDTGLAPNTTYYYQVAAENTNGWSGFSPVVSFTTGKLLHV